MHELGLMQEVLSLAVDHARKRGATRIHTVRMRVGVLSGVAPEALSFAFEALKPGTLAQEATLEIDTAAAACRCSSCGLEFQAVDALCECSRCGEPAADLRSGRELELTSMEVS